MKIVADSGKAVVRVPPIVEPIEVELAPISAAPQVRHIAVAVRILPDRTNVQDIIRSTAL